MNTLHSLPLKSISGESTTLEQMGLANKVLLIVNVASECGYTPQYEGLQALQEKFGKNGFSVIGFPSNDFGAQEPGSNAEIAEFCDLKYRVRFPMVAKYPVKGSQAQPFYAQMIASSPSKDPVAWNFEKFLLGKDGKVIGRFKSDVKPESAELIAAIESALKA